MRKYEPPKLERYEPKWPPDREKLVQHPSGYMSDPARPHIAYCPKCWLPFVPEYYPKHTRKECRETREELVDEVMQE